MSRGSNPGGTTATSVATRFPGDKYGGSAVSEPILGTGASSLVETQLASGSVALCSAAFVVFEANKGTVASVFVVFEVDRGTAASSSAIFGGTAAAASAAFEADTGNATIDVAVSQETTSILTTTVAFSQAFEGLVYNSNGLPGIVAASSLATINPLPKRKMGCYFCHALGHNKATCTTPQAINWKETRAKFREDHFFLTYGTTKKVELKKL